MISRKTITLLIFILLLFTFADISQAEVEIFKIQFRLASEVLPMIEPLLSPEGRVSVDRRTNSILVSDSPEAISKIRSFLTDLDKPLKQIRLSFSLGKPAGSNLMIFPYFTWARIPQQSLPQ